MYTFPCVSLCSMAQQGFGYGGSTGSGYSITGGGSGYSVVGGSEVGLAGDRGRRGDRSASRSPVMGRADKLSELAEV